MNNEVSIILKEIVSKLKSSSQKTTLYSLFKYIPVSNANYEVIKNNDKKTIAEVITLIKIERLNDLKIINEQEKIQLIRDYHTYKSLCDITKIENISLDQNIYDKIDVLRNKLDSYGLINEFNYEEALLNQVDLEILSRTLKRQD